MNTPTASLARSWLRVATSAASLCVSVLTSTCTPQNAVAVQETPGRVVPVENPGTLPPDHPEVPVGDPASNDSRVGRAPRRLSVDQLREALRVATGSIWVARRNVYDPDSPSGVVSNPEADMLEALAATLGRADYLVSTRNSIDPAVTFAKLAGDAARSACAAAVIADRQAGAPTSRRIMRYADPTETLAAQPAHVRMNLSYLAMRFWSRHVDPADPQLDSLVRLFGRASTAPAGTDRSGLMRPVATVSDGWRAVCIAMATDPQFLTY